MTEVDLFGRISMTKEELMYEREGAFFKGVAVGCLGCLLIGGFFVFLAFG